MVGEENLPHYSAGLCHSCGSAGATAAENAQALVAGDVQVARLAVNEMGIKFLLRARPTSHAMEGQSHLQQAVQAVLFVT